MFGSECENLVGWWGGSFGCDLLAVIIGRRLIKARSFLHKCSKSGEKFPLVS